MKREWKLTYFLIKVPFYFITSLVLLTLYRYLKISLFSFPVSKNDFKKIADSFLKKNNLIPFLSQIIKIDYQDTNEPDKDNFFMDVTYLYNDYKFTKSFFVKFFYKKNKRILLFAFNNGLNIGYCREFIFYKTLAPRIPVKVPLFLNGEFSSLTGLGYLIFKRKENIKIVNDHEGVSIDIACLCLRKIAAVHAEFIGSENLFNSGFREKNNSEPFQWILLFKKIKEDKHFCQVYNKICEYINKLPTTLIHADFRLGNLIFIVKKEKVEDVIIADWYYPCFSAALFDYCYFTLSGLDIELRKNYKNKLEEEYLAALKASGYDYPKERFTLDHAVVSFFYLCYSAALMQMEYFEDNGNNSLDYYAWISRLHAASLEVDAAQVAYLIDVEAQEVQRVIDQILLPCYAP